MQNFKQITFREGGENHRANHFFQVSSEFPKIWQSPSVKFRKTHKVLETTFTVRARYLDGEICFLKC